jgi:hypothetical protein
VSSSAIQIRTYHDRHRSGDPSRASHDRLAWADDCDRDRPRQPRGGPLPARARPGHRAAICNRGPGCSRRPRRRAPLLRNRSRRSALGHAGVHLRRRVHPRRGADIAYWNGGLLAVMLVSLIFVSSGRFVTACARVRSRGSSLASSHSGGSSSSSLLGQPGSRPRAQQRPVDEPRATRRCARWVVADDRDSASRSDGARAAGRGTLREYSGPAPLSVTEERSNLARRLQPISGASRVQRCRRVAPTRFAPC